MQIAIALFPGFLALNALGPYQVLVSTPGAEVVFVAEHRGRISDGRRVEIEATATFDEVDHPDVIVVPGGMPAFELARHDSAIVPWVRRVHPTTTWTTSVSTGALILGAAGVLQGISATIHWYARPDLARFGATLGQGRYVKSGKVITSAGVSAGIDMALALAVEISGELFAKVTQLDLEYDPDPPFDAGSPQSAPFDIVVRLNDTYDWALGRTETHPLAHKHARH